MSYNEAEKEWTPCPPIFCNERGKCYLSVTTNEITCFCEDRFRGDKCEINESKRTSIFDFLSANPNLHLILAVITIVSLLAAVVGLLIMCNLSKIKKLLSRPGTPGQRSPKFCKSTKINSIPESTFRKEF